MTIDSNTSIFLGQREIVEIKKGNTTIWQKNTTPVVEPDYFYVTNNQPESQNGYVRVLVRNEVGAESISPSSYTHSLQYSYDKSTWNTLDVSGGLTSSVDYQLPLSYEQTIYFRNDSGVFSYAEEGHGYYSISILGDGDNDVMVVGGDIRTLLDYTDVENAELGKGTFSRLFASEYYEYTDPETGDLYGDYRGGWVSDASDLSLPFMSLTERCYEDMFYHNEKLTSMPSLPATTLAPYCYARMFTECYSLDSLYSGDLPATTLADYCYYSMFTNTAMEHVDNNALPATNLAQYCYEYMFQGCSSLTTPPALPATTLAEGCYEYMFYGCTSLTTAPTLPATTLEPYCYSGMFEESGITVVPSLPSTTLATNCYTDMFYGCTALTTAPALPATTLAEGCYQNMFSNCQSLTTAPLLPATTLAPYCYSGMFNYCTSLVNAPALPANTLVKNCYTSMFFSCTNIQSVITYADDITADDCTSNWLGGEDVWDDEQQMDVNTAPPSGTIYNGGSATYTQDDPSGIPIGWTEASAPAITSVTSMPNTFTAKSWMDKARVSYTIVGHNTIGIDVPLSNVTEKANIGVNTGSTSRTITESKTYDNMSFSYTITQSANDTDEPDYVWFQNTGSSSGFIRLNTNSSGTPVAGSYTETIEWSTDKTTWTTVTLSVGNTSSITLPWNGKVYLRNDTRKYNTLNRYVWVQVTSKCNIGGNIRTLLDYFDNNIELNENGQFYGMFRYSDTKIVNAQDLVLPFTKLTDSCYLNMFYGCRELITSPSLPATTISEQCYQEMFYNCSKLTTAPSLPAPTLKFRCYQNMFSGCTALTTAPALPATTLGNYCYNGMFFGCTSLTTAPALPATTLGQGCYNRMFYGCTALTTAPSLPATTLSHSCYTDMFNGCTSLTTTPSLPATTISAQCYSRMFNGCTSLTTAPSLLPATTLYNYCYQNMFSGCTALTTAPALPATTLAPSCYEYMFDGCTSLNEVTTYADNISASRCLSNWLNNVASTGTFHKLGSATYPTGASGIPSGWTITTT